MFTVTLHSLGNATPAERAFADKSAALLQNIVNDTRFLPQVASAKYSSTWWESDQGEGEQLAGTDIVSVLASGRESRESADQEIDLSVSLMRLGGNVDGAVFPPSAEILIDASFFRSCAARQDLPSIAGLFMHEWMHTTGFRHDPNFPEDPDDVCYKVGDMATNLGRAIVTPGPAFQPPVTELEYRPVARVRQCPATIDARATLPLRRTRRRRARDRIRTVSVPSEPAHPVDEFRSWIPGFLAELLLDPREALSRAELDAAVRVLAESMGRDPDGVLVLGPNASQVLGRLDALFGHSRGFDEITRLAASARGPVHDARAGAAGASRPERPPGRSS